MRMALLTVILGIWGFIGWVINIVEMIAMINDPLTGMFILKIIGIPIVPIGIFLGWF